MQEVSSSSIEADIARLESGIRQLKVQYDMFFAGALPREPVELRVELDRIIRRNANAAIRKYAHRYHFNSLVSRFNAMSELWGKTMRDREEGDRPPPQTADRRGASERTLARCKIESPSTSRDTIHRLHESFCEARRNLHPDSRPVPFETFLRGISAQTDQLRAKSGCSAVELRVVVDNDRVQLKARPENS